MKANEIKMITSQPTAEAALQVCGELDPLNAHYVRISYIQKVFGTRATGGFFDPTRANVNAKFIQAWKQANESE